MSSSNKRYEGKVTIVTGGSKGIGQGCVEVFAEAGSNVVFCARNEADGKALEDRVNALGNGRALFVKCDVSKEDELKRLVEITIDTFGRIDCLINNAGWHPPHLPISEFSVDDARKLMDLNFFSAFILCKLCLPHLRKTQGNIINMSSLVGIQGQRCATTYCATKGALTSFSKALAIEEAANKVRVNIVSPGNVWTPLWREALPEDEKGLKEGYALGEKQQVMNRFGTIEESGKLCLFIAADATFTTGVDHILSGGAELGYGVKI
ncbi:17-beta-hydroxysteroid dehydrogenase 14 [Salpingoeca rosetta]|uniref:17-beta-hydroxysteroid dehydrogenase 14 n=1 Tax=Salpingoeca rosetta (strain ATCC 50818 / BSB-021) TaxID=946362 RepID=F2TX88_SALR5|nr:17-beta-hydroxysteroid dehydrogenase 14 [Salpingoeca rosetta]EGD75997.1 17-beta-hydroxysteroid dehydrogenase 14 [Salpingoeca rosetta]|eukprot:XP_004998172.1 17-beta-hydroxysteroid dehydrogenase 14 [Salpingoeca rosetta]